MRVSFSRPVDVLGWGRGFCFYFGGAVQPIFFLTYYYMCYI